MKNPLRALVVSAAIIFASTANGQTTAQEEAAVGVMSEHIADVQANRKSRADQIQNIITKIDVQRTTIKEASRVYDEVMQAERENAELGNPEGEFVKGLAYLAEKARARSDEWVLKGNPTIAEKFDVQAESFENGVLTATQYFESLSSRIGNIEARRDEMLAFIELNAFTDAQKAMNEGIAVLRQADERLEKVEKSLIELDSGDAE